MAKITLSEVLSGFNLSKINENFTKIAEALNNKVFWRNNPTGEPNQLESDLDANGKKIYNLPAPGLDSEAARLQDVRNALNGVNGTTPYPANLVPADDSSGGSLWTTVQGFINYVKTNVIDAPKTYPPSSGRDAIMYVNATSVKVSKAAAVMAGFRFRGQYTKSSGRSFDLPSNKTVSTSSNLGAESAVRTENWYAVFACANSGDTTATLKVMPFLRAGTVAGSNVPLIKAGEGVHALTAQTYAWSSTNNLVGTDCLVVTEGGKFSGRVTTITANVAGQITLGTIGSVAAYDFLLPAPPGFTHYVYLGSFYFDTAEVRNIADAGIVVKSKMVNLVDPNFTTGGTITSPVELRFGGYICPLALAVVVKDAHTLSTASTGNHAGYFSHDSSSHTIQENFEQKTSTGNETTVWDGIELPFSQWQSIWYSTGGSLSAQRASASLEIKGWIEP